MEQFFVFLSFEKYFIHDSWLIKRIFNAILSVAEFKKRMVPSSKVSPRYLGGRKTEGSWSFRKWRPGPRNHHHRPEIPVWRLRSPIVSPKRRYFEVYINPTKGKKGIKEIDHFVTIEFVLKIRRGCNYKNDKEIFKKERIRIKIRSR